MFCIYLEMMIFQIGISNTFISSNFDAIAKTMLNFRSYTEKKRVIEKEVEY